MEKNEYTYQSQVLKNEKGTQKSITHDAKIHSHQPHIYIPTDIKGISLKLLQICTSNKF